METEQSLATHTRLDCPECQAQGKSYSVSHLNPVVARRALSLHRWKWHGIRSPKAIKEAERKASYASRHQATEAVADRLGPEPSRSDKVAHAKWVKRRWAILNPDKVKAQRDRTRLKKRGVALTNAETAHRDTLQKASWWQVEQNSKPLLLDHCPNCGATFRMNLQPARENQTK
jgi:hypothetical protein